MPRAMANFSNPASAGAYSPGDAIANSATGASVTPMTFALELMPKGLVTALSCTVTPASSNLAITALDFDVLLFRPITGIPFAAASFPADNAPMAISAAAYRDLVAVFNFSSGNWRNTLGALTADITGWQTSVPATRAMIEFDTNDVSTLIGVVQAKGAWTPGAVINRFDFALEYSYP